MISFFQTLWSQFIIFAVHAQTSFPDPAAGVRQSVAASKIPFTSYLGLGSECAVNGVTVPDGTFLACYISSLYVFFVRAAVILAVLMIVLGGLRWLLAVGDSSKIKDAKDIIISAITGLVLALISWVLFAQINSQLVNLKSIDITPVNIPRTSTLNSGAGLNTAAPLDLSGISSFDVSGVRPEQLNWMDGTLQARINTLNNFYIQDRQSNPDWPTLRITSINDDHIFTGTCYRKGNEQPQGPEYCQHAKYSLHYGGILNKNNDFDKENPPISCAVDIALPRELSAEQKEIWYPRLYDMGIAAGFEKRSESGNTNTAQCETAASSRAVPCTDDDVNHIHFGVDYCNSANATF